MQEWERIQSKYVSNHFTPINKYNKIKTSVLNASLSCIWKSVSLLKRISRTGSTQQHERSFYTKPPITVPRDFPFPKKSWLMPAQATVRCPLGHQLFTSIYNDGGEIDPAAWLASLRLIYILSSTPHPTPQHLHISSFSNTYNLNEKSLKLLGSFPYGSVLCWFRAAPRQICNGHGIPCLQLKGWTTRTILFSTSKLLHQYLLKTVTTIKSYF